ncbi:aminotransferase class III-fold pyridoxal phosphate-dependent enzyme [Streptomyces sp. NPDC096934]|uniref:aminotransferase class III-fold pyridoxal phosphate-dependent enzyme n=1 Tax=Streptomyces sp. NPDC096934 TaxID=3155551 RepID=UPI0033275345
MTNTEWWRLGGRETARLPGWDLLHEYAEHVADGHARTLLSLRAPLSVAAATEHSLLDASGSAYLDLRCGGGVASLGHRVEPLVDALRNALQTLDIGDWQLPSALRARFAKELSATMSEGSWQWQFCVSGSESNEFALLTALRATGRDRIVALDGGYHGHTALAGAVTDPRFRAPRYQRLAHDVSHIPAYDDTALSRIDDQVAAVIVEPVQLTDAVRPLDPAYLRTVRDRCDLSGALLVFDEVKCGLNRTGPLWAHQVTGVVPDMLVAGKALSGGLYPVAACGIRVDGDRGPLMASRHDLSSSYAGSLLGMAVGQAALAQFVDPANWTVFEASAVALQKALEAHLQGAALPLASHRLGMAFEIKLESPDLALFVASDLLHRRVLVPFPATASLILLPPLNLPASSADTAARHIAGALAAGRDLLGGQVSM